jgi:exo-rhamnogalacturonan lyase-like protein
MSKRLRSALMWLPLGMLVCAACASDVNARSIELSVQNPNKFARNAEPITAGVPLTKGFVKDAARLTLLGPDDKPVPVQVQVTSKFHDGSPRWVLLDFPVDVPASEKTVYRLTTGARARTAAKLAYAIKDGVATVDTGAATFRIDTKKFRLFDSVKVRGVELIGKAGAGSGAVLKDAAGKVYRADQVAAKAEFEDAGSQRVVLRVRGEIGPRKKNLPLTDFTCRIHFYAGKAEVRVFFTLHNPAAHNHPGNIWDMGSGGSVFIEDFSLRLPLVAAAGRTCAVSGGAGNKIYQDSSGGPNWRSMNHVDKNMKVPITFRGYRVYQADKQVAEGHRIDGWLHASGRGGAVAVGIREFWQNFPKALEYADDHVRVALWPGEYAGAHELLGGEQKTHEIMFVFRGHKGKAAGVANTLAAFHSPMYAMPDPQAVLDSNAFWPTALPDRTKHKKLEDTIDIAVYPRGGGTNTIQTKWDVIDEYGWRHFGDTFADNEYSPAAMMRDYPKHYIGRRPISHYVNEYEVINTVIVNGLRRGDPKWMWMADVMARHHGDICVNHTDVDAPAYSHGSFMHTTHDTTAFRSGLRTYPIEARKYKLQYGNGGGPNGGHTYVINLANHYLLTGNRASRESFLEVAGWCADSPWFKKKMMGDARGYGNFFVTLLHAYQLTGDKKYYDRMMTLAGWIDKPFAGMGGTLFCKAAGLFLQMKIDNGELDDDYKKVQKLMMTFGDYFLTLSSKGYQRYLSQRCLYSERLNLCYLYAPKDHPNREKYYVRGQKILDEALDKFPGSYVATKTWVMSFSTIGGYLKAKEVHAREQIK